MKLNPEACATLSNPLFGRYYFASHVLTFTINGSLHNFQMTSHQVKDIGHIAVMRSRSPCMDSRSFNVFRLATDMPPVAGI